MLKQNKHLLISKLLEVLRLQAAINKALQILEQKQNKKEGGSSMSGVGAVGGVGCGAGSVGASAGTAATAGAAIGSAGGSTGGAVGTVGQAGGESTGTANAVNGHKANGMPNQGVYGPNLSKSGQPHALQRGQNINNPESISQETSFERISTFNSRIAINNKNNFKSMLEWILKMQLLIAIIEALMGKRNNDLRDMFKENLKMLGALNLASSIQSRQELHSFVQSTTKSMTLGVNTKIDGMNLQQFQKSMNELGASVAGVIDAGSTMANTSGLYGANGGITTEAGAAVGGAIDVSV